MERGEEGAACITAEKGFPAAVFLAPASALDCLLRRCWDLDNSSPYWWIIKGPIVLSVGVSPWGQCSLFYSANLLGSTQGPYTQETRLQAGI